MWTAIAALQRTDPDIVSIVYSGDIDASKEQIIAKVKVKPNYCQVQLAHVYFYQGRFDISLDPGSLHFVFLNTRNLVEDSAWPRFTLLGQSIGSMYLAWEAMSKLIPDLYIGQGNCHLRNRNIHEGRFLQTQWDMPLPSML